MASFSGKGTSGTTTSAIGQGIEGLTSPVIPTEKGSGIVAPTPLEYGLPILGIPKFIENFAMDNQGKLNPMKAPVLASLTVAHDLSKLGVINIPTVNKKTGLTASETKQVIQQMDLTYKKFYQTPKINTLATPKTAALLTSYNKLQTPQVQIQAYSIAPKVIKVGNAFKKVM